MARPTPGTPRLLIPAVGLWSVLVLLAYIRSSAPSFLLSSPQLLVPVPEPGWGPFQRAILLAGHLWAAIAASLVFLASFGAGRAVFPAFGGRKDDMGYALAVGIGIMGLSLMGLGLTGLLRARTVAVALAAGCAYGIPQLGRNASLHFRIPPARWWETAVMTAAGLSWILLAVGALAPETQVDSLNYHLGRSARFILTGKIVGQPSLFYSMPPLWEAFLVPAQILGGETAARLLNPLTVLATALLLRKGVSSIMPGTGSLAAALYLSSFLLNTTANSCKNDPAVAFFLLASFLALCDKPAEGARPKLRRLPSSLPPVSAVLGGTLAGFAASTKYNALAMAPALAIPILAGSEGRHRRPLRLVCFLAAMAATAAPWLARNAYETGNPLHPFSTVTRSMPAAARGILREDTRGYLLGSYDSLPDRFRSLWTMAADEGSFPLAALVLPVFLLSLIRGPAFPGTARPANRQLCWRPWTPVALGMCLGWTLGPPQPRYLLPALPLVCGAAVLNPYKVQGPVLTAAFAAIVMFDSARWLSRTIRERPSPLASAAGFVSPEAWRYSRLSTYAFAAAWANARLPAGAVLWIHGDPRSFPISRRVIATSTLETPRFLALAAQARNSERLAIKIRQEGVTHLVYNVTNAYYMMPRLSRLAPGEGALARWAEYFRRHATVVYEPPFVDIRTGGFYIYELGKNPSRPDGYLPGIEGWLYRPVELMAKGRIGEAKVAFARLRRTAGDFACLDVAYVTTFGGCIPAREARTILERAEGRGFRSVTLYATLAKLAANAGNTVLAGSYRARAAVMAGEKAASPAF